MSIFDDDIVNEIISKAEDADGFVFGTPVYYAHPSGRILSVLISKILAAYTLGDSFFLIETPLLSIAFFIVSKILFILLFTFISSNTMYIK